MSTDGRTDGRMDGRTQNYSPLRLTSGDNNGLSVICMKYKNASMLTGYKQTSLK